jgi:hypothetical protein
MGAKLKQVLHYRRYMNRLSASLMIKKMEIKITTAPDSFGIPKITILTI